MTPRAKLGHPTRVACEGHHRVRAKPHRCPASARSPVRDRYHSAPRRGGCCCPCTRGRCACRRWCPCAQDASFTCRGRACCAARPAASSSRSGERPSRLRGSMPSRSRCGVPPSGCSCCGCGGRGAAPPSRRESYALSFARWCAGGTAGRLLWPLLERSGMCMCETACRCMMDLRMSV